MLKIQENLKVLIQQTESLFNDTQNLIEDIQNKLNSGEFNGSTPEIGDNGNWIIDGEDTGKPSIGEIPEIIPISQGGTGNSSGYIQTGKKQNSQIGSYSTAEGYNTIVTSNYSHAEGWKCSSTGNTSHSEGSETIAEGDRSHAEGYYSHAVGEASHAEGWETEAIGEASHSEGKKAKAQGKYSHAEGSNLDYNGKEMGNKIYSSTEIPELSGNISVAGSLSYGLMSHAEGSQTLAYGDCSHSEGRYSVAANKNSHAEGWNSRARGDCSHSEGADTIASGAKSHAEGEFTRAEGAQSHSEGYCTVAKGDCCHAQGRYNTIDNNSKYLHIVGNGNSDSNRKNCHTIDWQGNTWYSGNLYIGGNSQEDSESFVANVPKYNENNNNNVLMVKNGILTWVPIEEIS